MKMKFMSSKDSSWKPLMQSQSGNWEIMIGNNANWIIQEIWICFLVDIK